MRFRTQDISHKQNAVARSDLIWAEPNYERESVSGFIEQRLGAAACGWAVAGV